jgi:hypothetical protein
LKARYIAMRAAAPFRATDKKPASFLWDCFRNKPLIIKPRNGSKKIK